MSTQEYVMEYQGWDENTLRKKLDSSSDFSERRQIRAALRRLRDGDTGSDIISSKSSISDVKKKPVSILDSFSSHEERRATFAWRKENGKVFTKDDVKKSTTKKDSNPLEKINDEAKLLQLLKEANDLDERISIRTALWKLREKQGKGPVGPLAFPKSVQLKAEERKPDILSNRHTTSSSSNLSNLSLPELEDKLQRARNYSEKKNIRSQILHLQRSQALSGKGTKETSSDPIKTKNDVNLKKDSDVPKYVEIEIKDANGHHDQPRDNGHRTYPRIQATEIPNSTSLRSRNSSGGSTGSSKGTRQSETEVQKESAKESPARPHPAFRQHSFSPSITELRSASRRNSGSRSSGSSRSQSPTHVEGSTKATRNVNEANEMEMNRINESPTTVLELEDQISVLQKELDSSTDFDRRREIRAEIRKIKAKMKDAAVKPSEKTKEPSRFDMLQKKSNFEQPKQLKSFSNGTKEAKKKLSVSVLRTRNPENDNSHAERTTTVENKRVSEGGTEYEEVKTTTTKVNRSARRSKYYETDKTTQRRVATKSGSEFNELDVTIKKDGYSASKDEDVQETAKAQILLTKTLGQAMRGLPFFRPIAPPQSNDLTQSHSNKSMPNPTNHSVTKAEENTDVKVQQFQLESEGDSYNLPPVSACPEARLKGMTEKLQEISYIGPRPTGRHSSSEDDNVFSSTQQYELEPDDQKPVLAYVQVPDTYKGDTVDKEFLVEKSQEVNSQTPEIENVKFEEPESVALMTEVATGKETEEFKADEESHHQEECQELEEETDNRDANELDRNEANTNLIFEKDENENIEEKSILKLDQDTGSEEDAKEGPEDENIEQAQLQIQDVNSKDLPLVTVPLEDLSVNDGDPASFSCEVEAPNDADVQWYRGSKLLVQSLDYTQIREGPVLQLLITETFSDDEGEYKVVVSTDSGTASTTAKLIVSDAPEVPATAVAPVVEKHLVDKMVCEGEQQIILQCQVSGSPEPTVTWYFGNRKLPNCGEFEQTYNGVTNVAKMVIAEIFLDDEGEYSCVAENVSGRVKSSCWIAVEDDTDDGTPSIDKPLKDLEAFDGDQLTLVCEVSGSPKPDLYWFHDEKRLQQSDDFELSYDGKVATLVIDEVLFPEDSGIYKLVVENSKGKTSTQCKVTIHDAPPKSAQEVQKLAFTAPLVDTEANDGDSLTLSCKLMGGKGATICWYKSEKVLKGVDFKQSFDGQTAKLEIREVFPEDRGTYSCVAKLGSSEAGTECKLTVTDPSSRSQESSSASSSDSSNSNADLDADDKSPTCVTNKPPGGNKDKRDSSPPGGQAKIKRTWPPTGENKFAANFSKFQASSKVTNNRLNQRPTGRAADKFLSSSPLEKKTTTNMDYNQINDENELMNYMEATQDFDERKKIRARMKVVREAKTAEWERQRAAREANKVDPVIERQRKAEEAKAKKLQALAEADQKAKQNVKVDVAQQNLVEKRMRAEAAKEENMKKMVEMGQAMSQVAFAGGDMLKQKETEKNAKLEEQETKRATKTEQGVDGSMKTTTTTVTTHKTQDGSTTILKKNKQITQVGGIGGTHHSITKQAAEQAADRIADFFSKSGGVGMSGSVHVKTESWNSRDGNTQRSEKSQSWHGARQAPRSAMSAFKQMDDANPNAGGGVAVQRSPSTIKQLLLDWCKQMTAGYEGINITNFSSSWNDGMAFCALSHHFWPEAFDYTRLSPKFRKANFAIAFDVAEKRGGIAQLLDVEDMVRMRNPDWKCVFTYVQQFYRKYRDGVATPTTPTTPTSPMTPPTPVTPTTPETPQTPEVTITLTQ